MARSPFLDLSRGYEEYAAERKRTRSGQIRKTLSLRRKLEVNVSVLDADFGRAMEASYATDLGSCREVDLAAFKYRSLGDRLLETLLYRFRKLL